MELEHAIPSMEQTFGQLEFTGEGNIELRRIKERRPFFLVVTICT
ncbi:hypothetical protein [Erysipelothrix aquatica]